MIEEYLKEALEKSNLTILDIQKAGCVVIQPKEKLSNQAMDALQSGALEWSKRHSIKVLVLDPALELSVIPGLALEQPQIYNAIDVLFQQVSDLTERLEAAGIRDNK